MIVVRLLRVRRRWRELQVALRTGMVPIRAELRRSRELAVERHELSRPHRFLWRWYQHPLTEAYFRSRRLRRARLERAAD